MDPWKSWAIVGVVGAGAAYYYSQSGKSKKGRGQPFLNNTEQSQRRGSSAKSDSKEVRKRKGKGKASDASDQAASDLAEASSSVKADSTDKSKKRKGGKQPPSKLARSSAVDLTNEPGVKTAIDDGEDEEMSNKEFAMQLSGLKTGSSLKKPDTANKENRKTKKQGQSKEMPPEAPNGTVLKPNGVPNAQDASTASSTTGADADDDLSLPVSPKFGATQATTPSGADVSDMLEAPAKGPSVLRVTEPINPQQARQPKQQKANPEPESKKQRQNRQKNEEKKALREQAEKDRRILLEKQLRTAREAEGRPAKNGLGGSKAPSTSAWGQSKISVAGGSTAVPPTSHGGPLLDTFDQDKSFLGDTPHVNAGAIGISDNEQGKHVTNGDSTEKKSQAEANPQSKHDEVWENDIPSEEEQMRLITEMDSDDTWKTVPKGRGKKRSTFVTPADSNRPTSSASSKDPLGSETKESVSISSNPSSVSNDFTSNSQKPLSSNGPDLSDQTKTSSKIRQSSSSFGTPRVLATTGETSTSGKTSEDPRVAFPHLDFEGGTFNKEDINDKGVSKYFRGKLLSNGKPDYNDPDYQRKWVPGMSVSPIYRPRPKHPGFREDGVTGRETFKTIDHNVWNHRNIQDHPDYDPDWPYALTGHPMDSDWVGDWDSSDMENANARRVEQGAAEKAERKARGKKGDVFDGHAEHH